MSFLKRLFGGGTGGAAEPVETEPVEYQGFVIRPAPFVEDGQHQVCALITKEVDGQLCEHRLIRADRFPGRDDAVEASLRKARQMIDEQGERIFR